ncbi:MAG: DUF5615 family PIN-like protein [Ideonella sp.]|nr:DUF5615 family PIN-like protein [Ideonella sp.]MCC7458240.1 DUF5615 family PIN-like protein [Nitrospira sp.]
MADLLLDENVPRSAGQALVQAGHNVIFVAVLAPGAGDRQVLTLAREHRRMLVTFDSDYGDLVFQQGVAPPPAIIYLRLHPITGEGAAALTSEALGAEPLGHLVVATPGGLRRRALPTEQEGGGARV